ncbi:MAG: hypothetical protein ACLFV2_04615 [Desulfurivibrionaceae bacterium]
MKFSSRTALLGSLFLIVLTIPLWKPLLVDFLAPPGFEHLETEKDNSADRFVIRGMKFTRNRDGREDTVVRASRAYGGSLSNSRIKLEGVSIFLYDSTGEKARVDSDRGSYDSDEGQVILPGEFTFTSRTAQIQGKELYYYLESGDYRIEGGVVCDLNSA